MRAPALATMLQCSLLSAPLLVASPAPHVIFAAESPEPSCSLAGLLVKLLKELFESLPALFRSLAEMLEGLVGAIVGFARMVADLVGAFFRAIGDFAEWIWRTVGDLVAGAVDAIDAVTRSLVAALDHGAEALGSGGMTKGVKVLSVPKGPDVVFRDEVQNMLRRAEAQRWTVVVLDCLPRKGEGFIGDVDAWVQQADSIRSCFHQDWLVTRPSNGSVEAGLAEAVKNPSSTLVIHVGHAEPDGALHVPDSGCQSLDTWRGNLIRDCNYVGLVCYSARFAHDSRVGVGTISALTTSEVQQLLGASKLGISVSNCIVAIGPGTPVTAVIASAGVVTLEQARRDSAHQGERQRSLPWGAAPPAAWSIWSLVRWWRGRRPRRWSWFLFHSVFAVLIMGFGIFGAALACSILPALPIVSALSGAASAAVALTIVGRVFLSKVDHSLTLEVLGPFARADTGSPRLGGGS